MQFKYLDKAELLGNCKRLPDSSIDVKTLKSEIDSIPDPLWNAEFRSVTHRDTSSLFVKGHPPIANIPEDNDRPILSSLPCIRQLIYDTLPGTPRKCLIAKLHPMGVIKLHPDGIPVRTPEQENSYDYFKSTIRIHIPVLTNQQVHFFVGDRFYHFDAGQVWAINNLSYHGVINQDPNAIRIHIIVDVIPNETQQEFLRQLPQPEGWKDNEMLRQLQN